MRQQVPVLELFSESVEPRPCRLLVVVDSRRCSSCCRSERNSRKRMREALETRRLLVKSWRHPIHGSRPLVRAHGPGQTSSRTRTTSIIALRSSTI